MEMTAQTQQELISFAPGECLAQRVPTPLIYPANMTGMQELRRSTG
jgi:hypothetical protein